MTTLRKLTLDDLWAFKSIGTVALSPDGRRVAFSMHSTDKAKNERQSAIWLLYLDEQGHAMEEPRQLTSGSKNDTSPVWAPDSRRLLFLSDREEERNQLWLIDTGGGEARKLTNMLNSVKEAAWSPNGQWIAFTSPIASTDDDELLTGCKTPTADEKKQREEEERIRLRTVTRIWYRLDGRGIFEKFNHLFVIPAPSDGPVDPATIRRLTSGDFDHTQPTWAPDSSEIGVLCNRADDRDRSFVTDLWAIDRETAEVRRISDGTLEIGAYAWSPGGRQAVLAGAKDIRLAGTSNFHLYLVSREGGSIEDMTADVDIHATIASYAGFGQPGPYRPQWSPDGAQVYYLITEHGCVNVHRLEVAQRQSTALTGGEQLTHFLALLPKEQGMVLAQAQPLSLWELYLMPLHATGAGEPERLTHLCDCLMSQFTWSEPERIHYRGANDDDIDGWLETQCNFAIIAGTVTSIW